MTFAIVPEIELPNIIPRLCLGFVVLLLCRGSLGSVCWFSSPFVVLLLFMILWVVQGTHHLGRSRKSGGACTLFLVLWVLGVVAGLGVGLSALTLSLFLDFAMFFLPSSVLVMVTFQYLIVTMFSYESCEYHIISKTYKCLKS